MSYLAERELNKSSPSDITKQNRDVEECTENAQVKEEIEKTFQEDFHPAILGKTNNLWVPQKRWYYQIPFLLGPGGFDFF